MLSHGNSSTSAASFSNGLKELRYSIARCIVAMRVRQTTGNVRDQCAEVGKKTTPSRDSPFYNDRTRSDDTRCLTESESLLALEDNELLPSRWGGSRRSGSLCQPAQQRFVKQYGIYATGPNRSEARVFRVICGDVWFDLDAANGAIRDRRYRSQRRYRPLFSALHQLEFLVLPATHCCARARRRALRLAASFSFLSVSLSSGEEGSDCQMFLVACQMFLVDEGKLTLS